MAGMTSELNEQLKTTETMKVPVGVNYNILTNLQNK